MTNFDWHKEFGDMGPDERFEAVMRAIIEAISSGLDGLGYKPHAFVLMLDAPAEEDDTIRSATVSMGFPDRGTMFEFMMTHATEVAGEVGIRMVATRATGPIVRGDG